MKYNTIPVIICVALFSSCATEPHVPAENAQVLTVSGQSKSTLFNKSRQWFSQYFVSGESVVDYESASAGTIIGKGIANVGGDAFGIITNKVHYTIRVDTKSGRMRVTTKIIKHTNTDSQRTYDVSRVSAARAGKAEQHLKGVVRDLERYVKAPSGSSSSNW